jgi:hypothetical protein
MVHRETIAAKFQTKIQHPPLKDYPCTLLSRAVRKGAFMKQTVYTASPESQQIHVLRLNSEGTLTLVQVVDVPGQVQPMATIRKTTKRASASAAKKAGSD